MTAPNPTDAAVISTANATWAMFWVTLVAALATLGAVLAAFGVQVRQFRHDRAEEQRRVDEIAGRAVASISQAADFVLSVEETVRTATNFQPARLWLLRGESEVHLRMLQWHMGQRIEDNRITWCGQSAIQRLYETRASLDHIVKDTTGRPPSVIVPEAMLTLQHAVDRLTPILGDIKALDFEYLGPARAAAQAAAKQK